MHAEFPPAPHVESLAAPFDTSQEAIDAEFAAIIDQPHTATEYPAAEATGPAEQTPDATSGAEARQGEVVMDEKMLAFLSLMRISMSLGNSENAEHREIGKRLANVSTAAFVPEFAIAAHEQAQQQQAVDHRDMLERLDMEARTTGTKKNTTGRTTTRIPRIRDDSIAPAA